MSINQLLRIHFLNVGHGDCTIIEHPSGRVSVIDINNGTKVDKDSYIEIKENLSPDTRMQNITPGGLFGYQGPQNNLGLSLPQAPLLGNLALQNNPGLSLPQTPWLGNQIQQELSKTDINDLFEQPTYIEYQKLVEKGCRQKLTNPIDYLESLFEITGRRKEIFRYIQTHPDMDHMRGLTDLLSRFDVFNFWDTNNLKTTPNFGKLFNNDQSDWRTYQSLKQGKNTKRLSLNRYDCGKYWSDGDFLEDLGDSIEILSPTPEITQLANSSEEHNNHSYVLRISFAGINIILGGDAEETVWQELVDVYSNKLKCHVLKASHHGRDSGYHQPAVKLMNPNLTVVSVGKKPDTDASNKYRYYSGKVLSTRWSGNIILSIWPDGKCEYEESY